MKHTTLTTALSTTVLIASSTLFLGCKSKDQKPTEEIQAASITSTITSTMTPTDTIAWETHLKITYEGKNSQGNPVLCHLYSPTNVSEPTPLLIAIHGATSSKDEWGEVDGYTKGGNITSALLDNGYSVIAVDLAHHGDHFQNTEGLTWRNGEVYDSIFTNHWEDFHKESLLGIEPIVTFAKQSGLFDTTRTGVASYSLGGYFINQTAQLHGSVKSLTYMVPGATSTPQFSAIENQDGLLETNVYMVAGKADEYIPYEETEQFFEDLQMSNKTFAPYESGHSLPIEYVEPLTEWFTNNL